MKVHGSVILFSGLLLVGAGCFPLGAPQRLPVFQEVAVAQEAVGPLELDLSGRGLQGLPAGLDAIPGLVRLRLRDNQLGALGREIASLAHVPWLDMGRAGVQSLPSEVAALQSLHSWWLSDNALTVLPAALTELKSLRYLNLDRNQLAALPAGIGELGGLRWLRLNGNRLAELPSSLTDLVALERLYLAHNRITELPEDIGRLVQLDTLVLTGNPMDPNELARVRAALPDCQVVFEEYEF